MIIEDGWINWIADDKKRLLLSKGKDKSIYVKIWDDHVYIPEKGEKVRVTGRLDYYKTDDDKMVHSINADTIGKIEDRKYDKRPEPQQAPPQPINNELPSENLTTVETDNTVDHDDTIPF